MPARDPWQTRPKYARSRGRRAYACVFSGGECDHRRRGLTRARSIRRICTRFPRAAQRHPPCLFNDRGSSDSERTPSLRLSTSIEVHRTVVSATFGHARGGRLAGK